MLKLNFSFKNEIVKEGFRIIIFLAIFIILIKFGTEKLENVDGFVKTKEEDIERQVKVLI